MTGGYRSGAPAALSPVRQVLVDADERDVPWLLEQAALAGEATNLWWLAGHRRWVPAAAAGGVQP